MQPSPYAIFGKAASPVSGVARGVRARQSRRGAKSYCSFETKLVIWRDAGGANGIPERRWRHEAISCQIGREAGRERVYQYVWRAVGAVSLTKNQANSEKIINGK